MYLYRMYRSPEGEGGGSGEGEGAPKPKTYTQEEYDAGRSGARSAGWNAAKEKGLLPFVSILKTTPGFEEITELNEDAFKEIATLASNHKKGAKANEETQRQLQKLSQERDAALSRYKNSIIQNTLVELANKSNNPAQVAKLLRSDYSFELVEDNGTERIRVIGPDGKPLMKDQFEAKEVKEVVSEFLAANPHFIAANGKTSTGAQQRTGMPGTQSDLAELIAKPVNSMTSAEKKRYGEALNKGELIYQNGKGVVVAQ